MEHSVERSTSFKSNHQPLKCLKKCFKLFFTHYESMIAELAVCTVKQSANRIFGLILNSYNVMPNHTLTHVFLSQNT